MFLKCSKPITIVYNSKQFLQIFECVGPNKHVGRKISMIFNKRVAPNKGMLEGKTRKN